MRLFSPEHLAAIAATVVGAAVLTLVARRSAGGESGSSLLAARALAVAILAGFVAEQATYVARGEWDARVNLPLQLSDAVTLIAIVALWQPRPGLPGELLWFLALTASLQAVLTPDLSETFPDVLFFTYFATHSGAVAGACLLVLGLRIVPRPRGALRAFGFTAVFAGIAAIGCLATGGNYMFLRRKPSNGSVLDSLGPWPWYILAAGLLGLAMLVALEALARRAAARGC